MITKRFGLAIPPQAYPILLVFLIIGVTSVLKGFPNAGFPLIGVGVLPLLFISGAQTDPDLKRLRNYTSFLGLKIGKWHSFDRYPELVIIKRKNMISLAWGAYSGGQAVAGGGGGGNGGSFMTSSWGPKRSFYSYELYAMDINHREGIMINRSDSEEDHKEMCRRMSQVTGLPWVSYSPYGRFPKKKLG